VGLPPSVLARRVEAARALRGISQKDLGLRLEAEGVGKHDAARVEREDPNAPPMDPARRGALSRVLRLPEWWWLVEDDELTARLAGDGAGVYADLEKLRDDFDAKIAVLQHSIEQITAADVGTPQETESTSRRPSRKGNPRGSP
jgi:transcriptional regulator with XRE-family HTH domain